MEHTDSQIAVNHNSLANILSPETKQSFLDLKDSNISNLHIIICCEENMCLPLQFYTCGIDYHTMLQVSLIEVKFK